MEDHLDFALRIQRPEHEEFTVEEATVIYSTPLEGWSYFLLQSYRPYKVFEKALAICDKYVGFFLNNALPHAMAACYDMFLYRGAIFRIVYFCNHLGDVRCLISIGLLKEIKSLEALDILADIKNIFKEFHDESSSPAAKNVGFGA